MARKVHDLSPYRDDVINAIKAGQSIDSLTTALQSKGANSGRTTIKRYINVLRAEGALPPGPRSRKEIEKAVFTWLRDPYLATASDQEIVQGLAPHIKVSARTVQDIRLKAGARRRAARESFNPSEELVTAVLLKLTDPGDGRYLPKDDELAEELNAAGFDTSEKEVFSIRKKNGIRHVCRGANRPPRRRPTTQPDIDPELAEDEDAEAESEPEELPPPPKLTQEHHLTTITLDEEATSIIKSIAEPIRKLGFDKTRPGVRIARHPWRVHQIVKPLIENLLPGIALHNMQVTALYISNHVLAPDALFGCWFIPLFFRRESSFKDAGMETHIDSDDDELENFFDDVAMKVGQALYFSKPVPVHCRVTGLLLSR